MGVSSKKNSVSIAAPKRLILAASIAAVFCSVSAPVHADVTADLLDKLKDKGVLTDDEYQEMQTQVRDERRQKGAQQARESDPSNAIAKFKDGFSLESADGANSLSVEGRIQADYRAFDNENGAANGFDMRRVYFGVKGKIANDWTYEATQDIANNTLEYAYINYKLDDAAQLRAGAFKFQFSFEEITSSRFTDFQERSMVNGFVPGKDQGVMIHGEPVKNTFAYAFGIANGSGKNTDETNALNDGKDIVARVAANFAPMAGLKDGVLHLGLNYADGKQTGAAVTSGQRTEARGITFFTGAALANAFDRERTGVEGVVAYGPVKLQSEWVKNNFQAPNGFDRDIDVYYASVNWMITGENYSDSYTLGGMRAIKPNREYKKGSDGWGAWEVGVRYSAFDASDFNTGEFTGTRKTDAVTVGLKWIPNTNTRVLLNYVQTNFDTPIAVSGKNVDKENAITLRTQLFF